MSKRRERRGPQPGEFHDPLKDYRAPEYGDDFEQSLCEDSVTVIEHKPFLTVRPDTPIRHTLRLMAENNIACVVVTDEADKPVGIVSELDVVHRMTADFERLADQPIESVMTRNPIVTYESETPARVLNIMGNGFFRHLPLCDVDGKLIGVIGARRLIDYLQRWVSESTA